jgi:hypothetical protein
MAAFRQAIQALLSNPGCGELASVAQKSLPPDCRALAKATDEGARALPNIALSPAPPFMSVLQVSYGFPGLVSRSCGKAGALLPDPPPPPDEDELLPPLLADVSQLPPSSTQSPTDSCLTEPSERWQSMQPGKTPPTRRSIDGSINDVPPQVAQVDGPQVEAVVVVVLALLVGGGGHPAATGSGPE